MMTTTKPTMKLSDTQLVILSAASQRADRNALPLPESVKGGAAQKVVGSLLGKGLVEERDAADGEPVWRTDDGDRRLTLVATHAALEALGILEDAGSSSETDQLAGTADAAASQPNPADEKAAQAGTEGQLRGVAPVAPKAAPGAPAGSVRAGNGKSRADSKQARLIALLQRPEGASLDEIVAATGWQAHTVRGAISGALKKKLGLLVTSAKVEGRGRVYGLPQ